ncbi:putative ATP synthase 24 kDa subunit, mitochondrial [Iris pallida]|uniref:ATP synthase 24 kDa subunit, mitochondrial n=1 Tax=Iris pallida TaxID=29817 RepID=A0AAX6GRZ0_IRIPA|nr:putative ATP synthase 24 kDa subunit, mitochondrial [Iris pallida]KAJ6831324.1 putative ATP synthase 24 kDa subunit, mitochondrial [Iris pallida]
MAMASRLLSRSKQFYASQVIVKQGHGLSVRSYAKESDPPATPTLKGDQMLKDIFYDVKKKFDIIRGIFRTERIILDPEDPAAVRKYADVMKRCRKEAGLMTQFEKVEYTIDHFTKDIPDVRTYLKKIREIRIKSGIEDVEGGEAMMMEALEKVEKEINKPLLRSDKKSMELLLAEFEKGNKRLGIPRFEDIPKQKDEWDLNAAQDDLEWLKNNAVEAMETQLKREEFKDEKMPDVRSLDIRNFM